jgi:hypothetical protein
MLVLLAGTIGSIASFDLHTCEVQDEARFEVADPGVWVVACETRSVLGGMERTGSLIAASDLNLVGPDGELRPLVPATQIIRYAEPSRAGTVIGTFDATAGTWAIRLADGGQAPLIAVGPDPTPSMAWWTLVSGGLAIVLLGAGAGFGWVAFRRSAGGGT